MGLLLLALACGGEEAGRTAAQAPARLDAARGNMNAAFMVRDLSPGGAGGRFTALGSLVFFIGWHPETGKEVWRSDGTAAGTTLLADVSPGATGDYPQFLMSLGNRLYFVTDDSVSGWELWTSDGTTEGTVQVADLCPGACSSYPHGLTAMGDSLFFLARDDGTLSGPIALWRHGPGDVQPVLLARFVPPEEGRVSWQSGLVASGGLLYFEGRPEPDGIHALWTSDGTPEGTGPLRDIPEPSTASWYATPLRALPDAGVLIKRDEMVTDGGSQQVVATLWSSDGTTEGTRRLYTGVAPLLSEATTLAHEVYFGESTPDGGALWRTDGTVEGTLRVTETAGRPRHLTSLAGRAYFVGTSAEHGQELWVSDGTQAGTRLLADVWPGPDAGLGVIELPVQMLASIPLALEAEGALVFAANDGISGVELWRSDADGGHLRLVADIAPGSASSFPRNPAPTRIPTDNGGAVSEPSLRPPMRVGDHVFFQADDGVHGLQLWAAPVAILADFRAPTLQCPQPTSATATDASGATVTYAPALATDDVTASPDIAYSHASGSMFPVGTTTVSVTARDQALNETQCQFTVTVTRPLMAPAPASCGSCTSAPTLLPWGVVLLLSRALRRFRRR